jgi:hypothetical protein
VLFGCVPGTSCPAEEKPSKRSVLKQPSSLEASNGDHAADLRGPLRIGSTLSEDFLLEYVNGMEGKNLGWGRLDADKLLEIMRLHAAYADLARQTPYVARLQGSNLLSRVLRSIDQAVKGRTVTGSLGEVGDRVLVIVGHRRTSPTSQGCWGLAGCSMAISPTTRHRGVRWYLNYGSRAKEGWLSLLTISRKASNKCERPCLLRWTRRPSSLPFSYPAAVPLTRR